jgi:site-specific DNA recombinase
MSLLSAIYARVSTDLQRENYSIPSQIRDILNYAKTHSFSLVGDHYVDPDTGKDAPKRKGAIAAYVDDYTSTELSRPGLDAALSFLESTGFDILLVHAIDRLARDPYYRQTIEREFKERGARVEYVLGNYDETPEGEVRKDLDATFAKWENAKRVERSNRGKKRKAEMGKFVSGKVAYGYRIDPDKFGGMSICESEAEIVRMIFNWFVENKLSLKQISKELKKLGIKSYHGHDSWAISSIHRLLSNTTYVGYFYYNKHKRKGKKLVKRDKSEWIKIECPPIVSTDMLKAAQEILKSNKEYMRKLPRRFYLLSGMIICAECKKAYVSQTTRAGRKRLKNDRQAYRHRKSHGHCLNKWISARKLEPLVWNKVANILLAPKSLREGYEQTIEQEQQKQVRRLEHLETLQAAIEKLKARKVRLQHVYLDPDIGMTKDEYLEEKQILDDQIKAANKDIEKIGKELKTIPSESDLKSLEQMASKIVGALGNNLDISPQDKRKVMKMLNIKVLISRGGGVKLEGWFTPESDGLSSTTSACCALRQRRLPGRA